MLLSSAWREQNWQSEKQQKRAEALGRKADYKKPPTRELSVKMRMEYISIVSSLCLVTCLSCSNKKGSQAEVQSHSDNQMSSAFREQAYRAFDAIMRVQEPLHVQTPVSVEMAFELRKIYAEKAIDEAKYKISTARDKEILEILNASLLLRNRSSFAPDELKAVEASSQCERELMTEFEPEDSNEFVRKKAAEKTCLKQLDTLWSALKERSLKQNNH
jgi:hypothetical protein